ncbi:hypothetical protein V7157_27685 [Neobacillus drentensis]|uniref:hypothetical protein n=1 Tax=Neobacillus drentensis TaxID=220684 RepID=UPI00300135EE
MNIKIEIHYKADCRSVQNNSLPLKGRKPEQIALQWWKQIKKEMSHRAELVKELENEEIKRIMNDDLPF